MELTDVLNLVANLTQETSLETVLSAAFSLKHAANMKKTCITYVSYSDVKKHKKTHMAHSIDGNEETPCIGDSTPPLNEDIFSTMHDEILDQLMEHEGDQKLKVWTSDIEKRDVYLTAKMTSPSWKKVIMRKAVDVENNKVVQVKYIGDKDWASMKEKIENGPLRVRTFMVYPQSGERYGHNPGLHH